MAWGQIDSVPNESDDYGKQFRVGGRTRIGATDKTGERYVRRASGKCRQLVKGRDVGKRIPEIPVRADLLIAGRTRCPHVLRQLPAPLGHQSRRLLPRPVLEESPASSVNQAGAVLSVRPYARLVEICGDERPAGYQQSIVYRLHSDLLFAGGGLPAGGVSSLGHPNRLVPDHHGARRGPLP